MKKISLITAIFICLATFASAQSSAENIAKVTEIQSQIKAIRENVKELNKQAFDKRAALNQEKDAEKQENLKSETNRLKLQIKAQNNSISQLNKQLNDLKKQPIVSNISINNAVDIAAGSGALLGDNNYFIEIFDKANYQGNSYKITKFTNLNSLNFANNTTRNTDRISIKKGPGFFKTVLGIESGSDIIIEENEPNLSLDLNKIKQIVFNELPSIQIFEQPNFRGKSVKILNTKQVNNINFPFHSNNISIRFSDEAKSIVYLSEKNNNNYKVFVNSEPNLSISTENINSIYIGKKVKIEVDFNGVLVADIHNNDCRKLYGQISYKLYETPITSGTVVNRALMPPIIPKNISGGIEENQFYSVFNKEKDNNYLCPFLYTVCNYCSSTDGGYPLERIVERRRGRYNTNGEMYLQSIANTPNNKQYFYIDSGSLFTPKGIASLTMKVKIKLGSAHKSNDFSNDFTWDAVMNETIEDSESSKKYSFIANKAVSIFQFGPYRKHTPGFERLPPTDKIKAALNNFSGPEHETYVQFSIKIVD